eukprot:4660121-Pyramimonas_sp.AAC.2
MPGSSMVDPRVDMRSAQCAQYSEEVNVAGRGSCERSHPHSAGFLHSWGHERFSSMLATCDQGEVAHPER